ncbi:HAT transposon superfamily [Quillaja saponaria]|uniref:HAT transposon superfamily n=1 Tax=Quillaja saponaria TaxID=32244 RepID=A0AAD7PR38_QUISA|nr:HAT transposon superfamily [Quillaja saponaria]
MAATASAATSVCSAPAKSDDPAWSHGRVVVGLKNSVICTYCDKHLRGGGITRLKQHLAGVTGQVGACKNVPTKVKWQMKQLLEALHKNQERKMKVITDSEKPSGLTDEDEDGMSSPSISKRKSKRKRINESDSKTRKRTQNCFSIQTTPNRQLSTECATDSNEAVENAKMAMAKWWYDANIPFSAAQSKYYQPMIDAIASVGSAFEGPSFHDLSGKLLKNSVNETQEYLLEIRREWRVYGCSVVADGWKNQNQASVLNFFAYCPKSTIFLKSVDVSAHENDPDTLFNIFDEVVLKVGVENVVQFITNNDYRYKAAGEKLEQRYGTFFWSPCAAQCVDLMLESFSDPRYFPHANETIEKARKLTRYIYNHASVLTLLREEVTNGRNLCQPAITRFATDFLNLQRLVKFRKGLIQMFTSNKWVKSSHAKSSTGEEITEIILQDEDFWFHCENMVKASEPLLRVLHLVDCQQKPAMGYLYDAIDKAKDAIGARFKNKVTAYVPYTRVIDTKWDIQLFSPLHLAGCFLNPGIYFRPTFVKQNEVIKGLLAAVTRLVPKSDVQDSISAQLEDYKKSSGDFGMPLAIRQREKLNPVAWWEQFGNDCPELQKFAVRVLSQCCCATGSEISWRTFEFNHSKKLNRLEYKRLNDLDFVRYNLKLRERNLNRTKDALDPINPQKIDLMEDWVANEPTLLDGEDSDWEMIDIPFTSLPLDNDDEIPFNDEDRSDATEMELMHHGDGTSSGLALTVDPYFSVIIE